MVIIRLKLNYYLKKKIAQDNLSKQIDVFFNVTINFSYLTSVKR